MPSPGELVAVLAIGFAAAMVYILVRFRKEVKEQAGDRAAVREEVGRRAAARGRRIENGAGETVWIQHGTLPGGEAWTLEYKVGFTEGVRVNTSGDTGLIVAPPDPVERDYIAGQRLEWRCPALKREALAFSFYRRADKKKREDEIVFDAGEDVWSRWRVEARDEATARRAFGPATVALLRQLPRSIAWNTRIDERTWITLGQDGLVACLGAYNLGADLVDLWVAAAEAIAAGVKG